MLLGGTFHSGSLDFVHPVYPHETPLSSLLQMIVISEYEVKDAIRAKKEAKKKWDASERPEERDIYRQANKEAKKEVARSKAHAMDEVYKELETPEAVRTKDL